MKDKCDKLLTTWLRLEQALVIDKETRRYVETSTEFSGPLDKSLVE